MKTLYKYYPEQIGEDYMDCHLGFTEFEVVKETEKSYQIVTDRYRNKTKWCRKDAWNKWYAHDTKAKALRVFIARKKKHLWYMRADLQIIENCVKEAQEELKKISHD